MRMDPLLSRLILLGIPAYVVIHFILKYW